MSDGERDLDRLLADLKPRLHQERYAFAPTADAVLQPGDFALIREDEGLAAIRQDPAGEWACITLEVHSSLHAIGMTAAISARLTEKRVSANIVAALRHDHVFIPWNQRELALDCLERVQRRG